MVIKLVSGNIEALLLLPNVTSQIQPLDQGALENMNGNYQKICYKLLLNELRKIEVSPRHLKVII